MDTIQAFSKARFLGIFLVGLLLPTLSFAGIRDDRSFEIQGLYTFILGAGASLSYNLGDHLAFGVNYYAASYEGEGENTENNETLTLDFSTSEIFLRLFPFEGSGFYVSGAAVVRDWEITVSGTDSNFGGTIYAADYELTAEWPNTGFAYGLGFNWIADFGLSGGLFLGVLTGEDPELKGKVNNTDIPQEIIDQEVDKFAEDEDFGNKYNTAPLLRFSIGYNF